ncbi:hypothetical protein N657DRAFT_208409 [Parathielavia appendiculata]|uniref:Uncharacterized protein n=1 Tax=Parathielavia appendiculata TaxID=2587402 RepID=A0AAN6U9A4_9PEZI|nr:hypothetical protein N657DRAFT_208409 [Parathielavia appendiculata]
MMTPMDGSGTTTSHRYRWLLGRRSVTLQAQRSAVTGTVPLDDSRRLSHVPSVSYTRISTPQDLRTFQSQHTAAGFAGSREKQTRRWIRDTTESESMWKLECCPFWFMIQRNRTSLPSSPTRLCRSEAPSRELVEACIVHLASCSTEAHQEGRWY